MSSVPFLGKACDSTNQDSSQADCQLAKARMHPTIIGHGGSECYLFLASLRQLVCVPYYLPANNMQVQLLTDLSQDCAPRSDAAAAYSSYLCNARSLQCCVTVGVTSRRLMSEAVLLL